MKISIKLFLIFLISSCALVENGSDYDEYLILSFIINEKCFAEDILVVDGDFSDEKAEAYIKMISNTKFESKCEEVRNSNNRFRMNFKVKNVSIRDVEMSEDGRTAKFKGNKL